jgi:hypothetical protein
MLIARFIVGEFGLCYSRPGSEWIDVSCVIVVLRHEERLKLAFIENTELCCLEAFTE